MPANLVAVGHHPAGSGAHGEMPALPPRPPGGAGHMAAEIASGWPVTPCCVILWTWGLDPAVEVVLLTVVGCLDGAEETGVPRPSRVGELSALGLPVDGDPLLHAALEGRGAAGWTSRWAWVLARGGMGVSSPRGRGLSATERGASVMRGAQLPLCPLFSSDGGTRRLCGLQGGALCPCPWGVGPGEGAGTPRLSSGPVLPSGAGCAAEAVFPVGAAPTSPTWVCRKGLSRVFSIQLKTIPCVRVCVCLRLHIHSCRSVSSSGRRVVGLGERVVLEDLNTSNLWTSSCGLKKRSNQPALCVARWVADTAICEQTPGGLGVHLTWSWCRGSQNCSSG